jgi:hypothetical protein
MACDVVTGRKEVCLDNVGGLRAIYFVNFEDLDPSGVTESSFGVISSITGTTQPAPDAYKYELIATTNTFDEVGESSRDNGTAHFVGTLTANLKKIRKEDAESLYALATGRPHVIVEYNTGVLRLVGLQNGVTTSVSANSGGAFADFSGYILTILSDEQFMAPFFDGAITDFVTVVEEVVV